MIIIQLKTAQKINIMVIFEPHNNRLMLEENYKYCTALNILECCTDTFVLSCLSHINLFLVFYVVFVSSFSSFICVVFPSLLLMLCARIARVCSHFCLCLSIFAFGPLCYVEHKIILNE